MLPKSHHERKEEDEVTGLSRRVVSEQAGTNLRPRLSVKDESGKTAAFLWISRNLLPVGAHILWKRIDCISWNVLAKNT